MEFCVTVTNNSKLKPLFVINVLLPCLFLCLVAIISAENCAKPPHGKFPFRTITIGWGSIYIMKAFHFPSIFDRCILTLSFSLLLYTFLCLKIKLSLINNTHNTFKMMLCQWALPLMCKSKTWDTTKIVFNYIHNKNNHFEGKLSSLGVVIIVTFHYLWPPEGWRVMIYEISERKG